jgi:hypothetical protein
MDSHNGVGFFSVENAIINNNGKDPFTLNQLAILIEETVKLKIQARKKRHEFLIAPFLNLIFIRLRRR